MTSAARRPVLHHVMPGLEVARAEPRAREEIRRALDFAPKDVEGHALAALTSQRKIAARQRGAGRLAC